MSPEALVMRRVQQALDAGIDGVVASAKEAAKIRTAVPDDFIVLTPGIRMAGDDIGDQKRIATPAKALKDGASHIVVGRPITQSPDPEAAAQRVLANIAQGS
jgi:orotidine-5'-phosphate decarboxylase